MDEPSESERHLPTSQDCEGPDGLQEAPSEHRAGEVTFP